ncbi:hypothetical protein PVK06_011606 [Gossypium arboreum]|uniref:Uncharacterized protein n=1 Tax=Gossypium arboreum TaxID=29729 RepID=A0ABR0Q9Z9_GOSAR|nr:hypothetical protein PVK06_011606 [Gossypium arboreum]
MTSASDAAVVQRRDIDGGDRKRWWCDDGAVAFVLPDYRYFEDLPIAIKEALESRIKKGEVKAALESMAPLKATGKDHLNAKFYQSQWDIVGDSVYKMVLETFEGKPLDPMINNTVLVLLLKVDKLETLSQYRSISLYSAAYKIATKTIVRRLKFIMALLVAPSQVPELVMVLHMLWTHHSSYERPVISPLELSITWFL